jgi:hypothetical protein
LPILFVNRHGIQMYGVFLRSNVKENCTQYKSGEFQTGGGQIDAVEALGGVMLTVTEFSRKKV